MGEKLDVIELDEIEIYYGEYEDQGITITSDDESVGGWWTYHDVQFTYQGRIYGFTIRKHNSPNVSETDVTVSTHLIGEARVECDELIELRQFKQAVISLFESMPESKRSALYTDKRNELQEIIKTYGGNEHVITNN